MAATMLLAPASPATCETDPGADEAHPGGQVVVRYLGSSGLSIRLGEDSILTAPFFSNPSLLKVIFAPIAPKPALFPTDLEVVTRDVRGVLVGHSHYDHLMDLPLVARGLPEDAVIYGSRTAAHILAGAPELKQAVEVLNGRAGTSERPGLWIPLGSGRIRFMAVASDHAPHFAGMRFYDGTYDRDLKSLPRFAGRWRLGQPFTFIIDLMDSRGRKPVYRIFFQDAATDSPQGFPPILKDGKGFDLAILCVASFSRVKSHPEAILSHLKPGAVLLTHWEDFFSPPSDPVRVVPGTDLAEFIRRMEAVLPEGTSWHRPVPGDTVHLPLPGERPPGVAP